MAKLRFTNKAVADLTDIWNYTVDTWSEEQADRYYEMLLASSRKIAENPELFGQKYELIAEDLYGFKAQKHIIFYHIETDGVVEILRILHESMDLKNRITE